MKRAETLVHFHEILAKRPSQPGDPVSSEVKNLRDDLLRAAVIIGVAALDTYFTDKFLQKLTQYLKHNKLNDNLVNLLEKAGLSTKVALQIYLDRSKIRKARHLHSIVQNYLEKRTTTAFQRIDELFAAYGIASLSSSVQSKLGKKRVVASIERIVERRHEIAHTGDQNGKNSLRRIDRKEIVKRLADIGEFVAESEEFIENLGPFKKKSIGRPRK
ncbi:MAG: hypothetical protein EA369_09550 [Bradymonadales bacterium]|nr:MAG: hypothetical protein EA369_09550 [Bradymonadales bacterium]